MKEYLPFCSTDRQREILSAVIAEGGQRAAARSLGTAKSTVDAVVKIVTERAAMQGLSPEHDMVHTVPAPYHVKGVSTLYNKDGQVSAQWVKTRLDEEMRIAALQEAVAGALNEYKGMSHKVPRPRAREYDLLSVYPMGDPHIGMYAWAEESGEDFNLDIARTQLKSAVHNLVDRSPRSHTALILNLGDFFHSDNLQNRTMRSGNVLDVDTRWPKVMRLGVDLMVECIYAALAKHERVIVRNNIGNHDDHSSAFLSIALDKYFHNNKRVEIDMSPGHFWFFRFGRVLIGSTHGDTVKPEGLPGIMATMEAKAWGETLYRYWYTGHIHSKNAQEFPGCMWESFRTLAARDAWHAAHGYLAGRDMQCIVHHRVTGEEERHVFNMRKLTYQGRRPVTTE